MPDAGITERRAAGHLAAVDAAAAFNRAVVALPAVVEAGSTAAEAAVRTVVDMAAEAIAKTRRS
jgi:hypothetical protein